MHKPTMRFRLVFPFLAALAVAPGALAQPRGPSEDDEIVVTAERPRGSVLGGAVPETTFSAADLRSYGASSIFQILAALAPQTGSASIRGAGVPIVLLNGRRISGIQEIRDLPPDVISRVEVFDEQLSLQYGYSPDQRVVNIVLVRRYTANLAEVGGGRAAGDARASSRFEASGADIDEGERRALGLSYDSASAVKESERGIAPPLSGADDRGARTLAPDTANWRANASYSRALNPRLTGTTSLRLESGTQRDLLGRDQVSLAPLVRDTETDSARASAGLDGAYAGWQWTATATGELSRQERDTQGALAHTRSEQSLVDAAANAGGAVFEAPAGPVRAAFRLALEQRRIESFSRDSSGERRADLDRTTPSGRVTFSAPLTSRRREFGQAFGDISLNATAAWSDPSDFAALTSLGFGGSWSPTGTLRFSLQSESSETAPSLQQLGDPALTTPDVAFFDAARGETVRVARTSGGNSALGVETRDDLTFNANYSPNFAQGLTLSFSWAHNDTNDFSAAPPFALLETEAAFAPRFTRDVSGALIAIDARPLNIARRDVESVRWGVNFSTSIGGPSAGGGERAGAPQAEPIQSAEAPASPAERRAGLGGGERAGAGRWSLSIFHRLRLVDDLTLSAGLAPIDLIDRGGLDGGGETASAIEFEGGVFYRGLGLRFNGGWSDAYSIPIAGDGALDFSERWTINARAFVNFDQRPAILGAAPWLAGSRLAFGVENLTDSLVEVSDGSAITPAAYQEGYLSPLGRVVQLSFRKRF